MLINKRILENKLYKLSFAPTLLVCLVMSLFFLLSFLEQKNNENRLQIDVVSTLFENLSIEDKDILDRISTNVLQRSTYFGITITDKNFTPLFTQGIMPNGADLKEKLSDNKSIQSGDKVFTKRLIRFRTQSQNTPTQNQEGWLIISKGSHIHSLWYYQAGSFFLLLMLYAFISITYFSHRLKKEINQDLEDVALGLEKLAEEDYSFRLKNNENRVFSPLVTKINNLSDSIQDAQEYLRNVVETSTNELRESLETVEIQNIEIDLARKNALKSNELTCEFLANTSHEVRTPINGIIGFSNLLRKTAITDQQAEYIDTIEDSAKVLLFNMNDMIDYSRLEVGKLNLDYKPVDVREIIIDSHNYVLTHKGHDNITIDTKISQAIPRKLLGDSMRMQQVYNNLLSCAADLTHSKHLTSHVDVAEQDGGSFTIRVSVCAEGNFRKNEALIEAGKLLSAHNHDNINLTSKNMMSLVIAKGLINRMNGQIGVSLQQDKTDFWLTLELGSTTIETPKSNENITTPSVLVVDDNPANRRLVQEILSELKIEVESADSGEQALKLLKDKTFNLILMDIQMPGMDGFETSMAIRARETSGIRTPIVALTAHAVEDEKSKILLSGMDDFVSKPVGESELCELISRWTKTDCRTPSIPSNKPTKSNSISSQPVNISASLDLAKGKEDLAKDMLEMLLNSIRRDFETMKQEFSSGDHVALQEKVHKIHGGACYCGVPRLLESSAKLDKALIDGNITLAEEISQAFFENCEELMRWQESHDLDEIFAS